MNDEITYEKLDLELTIPLMRSTCFKDRLRAEYHQTNMRYIKLMEFIAKYETNTLPKDVIPRSSIEMLKDQASAMRVCLMTLQERCIIEGADLALPLTELCGETPEEDA